jgi:mRNA interferase YafQ
MVNKLKYQVISSKHFDKQIKKIVKQGKDINKIINVVKKLANGEKLEPKYRDHILQDTKYYYDCRECHIEPDWLLIYKYNNDKLILYLVETGSHSDLFNM